MYADDGIDFNGQKEDFNGQKEDKRMLLSDSLEPPHCNEILRVELETHTILRSTRTVVKQIQWVFVQMEQDDWQQQKMSRKTKDS